MHWSIYSLTLCEQHVDVNVYICEQLCEEALERSSVRHSHWFRLNK